MVNDTAIWLERLASLHKSQMRKAACAAGLQLVHLEILQYLSVCNRYSNTAQALSEYLGQTKGSISQSLKFVQEAGHIERKPCQNDKRVSRLHLTLKGKACLKRVNQDVMPGLPHDADMTSTLKKLLQQWQALNGCKSFGQCNSCRFHQIRTRSRFHCGLADEPLSKTDAQKICREHEF